MFLLVPVASAFAHLCWNMRQEWSARHIINQNLACGISIFKGLLGNLVDFPNLDELITGGWAGGLLKACWWPITEEGFMMLGLRIGS